MATTYNIQRLMAIILFILSFIASSAQGDYEKVRGNYRKAEVLGLTGAGVKIAVIDVGGNRVGTRGVDDIWIDYTYGYDFVDEDTVLTTSSHHGNFVLSIIKSNIGLAPDATVYFLKVANDVGTKDDAAVLEALQYCIDSGVQIITVSLSLANEVEEKVAECIAAGIAVVGATGPDIMGQFTVALPGTCPGAVAVTAISSTDGNVYTNVLPNPTVENSHGVSLAASGVDCDVIGRTGVPVTSNGPSFSAPWIAGAFAIYKQRYPTMSNQAVMQMLIDRAIKLPNTTNFGAGRPTF